MLCQFERVIYPSSVSAIDITSFMIALYRPCENIKDSSGNIITQVKAVGYCLPTADNMRYEMRGHWSKNPKHGIQFEVEGYDEVIIPTREGIIAYLSSGQIKGIGPKMAERIYDAFGNMALEVLDKEPEKLLTISGISPGKLKKICDSYLANRGARDVVAFLSPHGITPNRAVKLYKEYGDETMQIVKNHPYKLCKIAGIGFKTTDKIAMSMGFDRLSPERVDEGILYTLTDAEGRGHLCMDKEGFIKACKKVLETPELTDQMIANRANKLIFDGRMLTYGNCVYRERAAKAEEKLADLIRYQLRHQKRCAYGDLEAELDHEEMRLRVCLAPEQRDAIKTALTNGISIITGGPGTGKTMLQKALLGIYSRNHPSNKIICCAPTVIIATIKHKSLLPSTTLGSHKTNIRYTSRLLCIIITRLFFKVIAALIRYQKRSCFIVHAFALILWASEKFKPLLRHLHTRSSTISAISSRFTGYNRMTYSSIFIGRMLEQGYLTGNFF